MNEDIENIIGKIEFDNENGWVGFCTCLFFNDEFTLPLYFGGDDDENIDPIQVSAVERFIKQKDKFYDEASSAIYSYYNDNFSELRNKYGDAADDYMPHLRDQLDLKRVVSPVSIVVSEPLTSDDRVIGLLFDCSWDPSLGLAVKFVNERIDEVGSQDIVL